MDEKVLGIRPDGSPIKEIPRGCVATAAFVICVSCGRPIRSMGGPIPGAKCVSCYDGQEAK